MIFTFLSIFVSSSCLSADPDDWSALKSTKNRVAKVIKTAKKNYFHEFFRVNEHNPKKNWSVLKNLSGKQNTRGVTYKRSGSTQRRLLDIPDTNLLFK